MNEYDRLNVQAILEGHGTWFTAMLFRLIAKADQQNLAKLDIAFPEETRFVSGYLGRGF